MKKVFNVALCAVAVALSLLVIFFSITQNEQIETYPLATVVVNINREQDVVTVRDNNGNEWEFTEVNDWYIGDGCNLEMNTMGTDEIYDDEIISMRYFNIEGLF